MTTTGASQNMFNSAYKGRSVFVTGQTGFKGSWLCLWLEHMGASVTAYALEPATDPNHFVLAGMKGNSLIGNVCDYDVLANRMAQCRPEIVFHLAAQASVLYSYKNPLETFSSNVLGTANVLEACRRTPSVRAVVIITTDKCYENREWLWGYRENDALGGHDPYSASKACVELVVSAFRRSFLSDSPVLVASARAGNVIGGGDWTADRLVPDVMRATAKREKVIIRNPDSVRPWQHVLEPLSGYLLLGQLLFEGKRELAQAWNFGPDEESHMNVLSVVKNIQKYWPEVAYEISSATTKPHEAGLLNLDCSKAKEMLNWKPVWGCDAMLEKTALWYKTFYGSNKIKSIDDILCYITDAKRKHVVWAGK